MTARLLAAALLFTACIFDGDPWPNPRNWKLESRATTATADALDPDKAEEPGEGKPQALFVSGDHVLVLLTNLRRNPQNGSYSPAGASFVEVLEASTLARRALVAIEKDGHRCFNAGAGRLVDDTLYVACAGHFADDGALAELDAATGAVRRVVPTGFAPGAIAKAGHHLWLGDLLGGRLLRVDADDGAVLNGLGGAAPIEICPSRSATDLPFVSDVIALGSRTFAACFSHDEVLEFAPANGARIGEPLATGDAPMAFAALDQSLFVLDNLGATLSRIRLTPSPLVDRALLTTGQVPTGIDVAGGLLAITNSGDGTVTLIDPATLEKLASVDLKEPAGGSTYPWGVAFSPGAKALFVALNGTGEVVKVARVEP